MNSLLFLSEQDFAVQQGKRGYVLCTNVPGVCLTLFFSRECPHCKDIFPIFNTLPQVIPGCQFALLNISQHPNVARMSQKTIAPITHVPFIVLYVNGRPFMKYNGNKTLRDIGGFVNEVMTRIQTKKNFSSIQIDHDESIPDYSVGIPFNVVCEGEQCYLSFNEAYRSKSH
jgi:thiol-disulfide isomerase/thioredoxin